MDRNDLQALSKVRLKEAAALLRLRLQICRRTDSSTRFSVICPDRTARSSPAIAVSGTGGINSTSAPASTALAAASPGGYRDVTPPISIASVTTSPLYFNSSRNNPPARSTPCGGWPPRPRSA